MSVPTAPPPGLAPPSLDLGAIAGPQLIGSLLNYCLYGVLVVQVYIYRLSFPRDNTIVKCLVYFALIFETVSVCLNAVDIFDWFGTGFGDIQNLADPGVGPIYTPIMGSIMALVVEIFFCYRIWVINRKAWWWSLVIAAVSITQCVGGFVGGVLARVASDVSKRHAQDRFVYLWLVGDAVADIMIAGSMTYLLLRAGNKHHRQTNDIVMRIVQLTVETNSVSATVAIVSLILFAGAPGTTYFITPTMILGKLYANTLLVTFNNRAFLHKSTTSQPFSSSYVSSSNTYSGSRVSSNPGSVPLSAGLKFFDPGETVIEQGVTITSQTHTIGDNEIKLDTMRGEPKLHGHL
ncbi:hypothetical protein Hypma_011894 [Hypsizygus marmoreus]|uniref:DUF6534 domain-containing protein n=1 Tax=Hypsizygus marmoreus TaxID=39966 RepID=A0A369JRR2_HYPMA|nr:hypothetical protein Hypma_011894 [Hypsizygus marmoreus]